MGGWITTENRKKLYERDNYTCRYCDKKISGGELSLDHIIARSKGGSNKFENLVTACPQCQWKKHDKTLEEVGMVIKGV